MVCPAEFAAQVDAAVHCPFTSRDVPAGVWGMNAQGNVFLKEPNFSYHYFNRDGGYYFQKADGPDEQGHSVYISPPGHRYYNPSTAEREEGAYFVGIYWETAIEKMCFVNSEGFVALTLRKHVEPRGLPRRRVAVYVNSMGMHRVVEVNERGIYGAQDPKIVREIRFWLANNVPIGYRDGPRLVDDTPRAWLMSPPPDDFDDAPRRPHSPNTSVKGHNQDGTPPSRTTQDFVNRSNHSAHTVKQEADLERADPSTHQRNAVIPDGHSLIKKEELAGEELDLNNIPSSSTSARNCLTKLFAARPTSNVQGGRVSKRASSQESATKRAILLRPENALRCAKASAKPS